MPVKAEQESVILAMDRGNGDVRLITTTLEKAGFQVSASSDQPSILNLCRAADHCVRLVIIDTTAPEIQTSELVEGLRQIDPGIRVITVSDQNESHTPGTRGGHLTRPFRRAQLLGSVLEATQPLYRTA